MNLLLEDKVALVTGGNTGIGVATVKALAREGARVALTYLRDEDRAHALVAELCAARPGHLALEADVRASGRAEEVVEAIVARHGRLDILVNNAGINRDAVVWKMTDDEWHDVVETDLTGTYRYIRAVAPRFKEARSGKIITVSSINGLRGKFGQANYAAAKAGVIGLSKSVARELGRYNVNVNVVCPGLVATEMTRDLPDDILKKAVEETVLGRAGAPEDVAELIVFLASERARHITGDVIRVDGGQYI